MTLLVDLPETLDQKIKAEAQERGCTPEALIVDILAKAFEDDGTPSVAEVVERIKAIPPNPAMVTPPQGSLVEALRNAPSDPDFDLEAWNQEWAAAVKDLERPNLGDAVLTQRQIAMALLQSWRNEQDAEEQKETGAYLQRVLDEDRLSDRKLFPPELRGITW